MRGRRAVWLIPLMTLGALGLGLLLATGPSGNASGVGGAGDESREAGGSSVEPPQTLAPPVHASPPTGSAIPPPTPLPPTAEPSPTESAPADPPVEARIELVGSLQLEGGTHADVWGHRGFAYVGTWSAGCPGTGVKVVDLADPSQPRMAATLASHHGTSADDMVVIRAHTPAFSGDLLAVGLQTCGQGGIAGVEFWDVSQPYQPQRLGWLATPGTVGVHELHMFQRGEQVLALLAVPYSEQSNMGGDFRIVDATDPRAPVQLADWGMFGDLGVDPAEARGQFPAIFGHSASVSPDGTIAYVSYWDAGLALLDISDPSEPRFLGRITYAPEDEGNTHSAAATDDGELLVVADEDIHPVVPGIRVDSPPALAGAYEAAEASFTAGLRQAGTISAPLAYVGRACPEGAPPEGVAGADPFLEDPRDRIALIDRGDCFFSAKLARVAEAGALAAIVVNNLDGPPIRMTGTGQSVPIPGVMIGLGDGQRLRQMLRTEQVHVTIGPDIAAGDGNWGFLRFYDITDPANPLQISTFATANALTDRETGPPDDGHYTVHNPFIVGDRLYASWFSDGFRLIDISDRAQPREIASFVPPPYPDPTGLGVNPAQPMVWGVFVLDDLVLLSDMNFGLYVLRVVES